MIGLPRLLRTGWTYLVAGAAVTVVGAGVYATAHPASPVEVDGTIAGYVEYTQNGAYDRNDLSLADNSITYRLDKTTFHPALPDSFYRDGQVSLWVDQGSTTVIAIELYDANDQNPVTYTTDLYDHPSSERSGLQLFGLAIAALGATLFLTVVLRSVVGSRRRPAAVASGAPPPIV